MERDHAAIIQRQDEINGKSDALAARYLKESVSWVGDKLNPNNFSTCKQRLLNVIGACRSIGFDVPEKQEQELIQNLQRDFEQAVRDQFAREEQARIKRRLGRRKSWLGKSTSRSRMLNAKRPRYKRRWKRPSGKPRTNTVRKWNC